MRNSTARSPGRFPTAAKQPAGLPNWVMTFADLMTLLLTFFILLLSFSVMDIQRYKSIADALRHAFSGNASGPAVQMPVPTTLPADDRILAATPEPPAAVSTPTASPAPTLPSPPVVQDNDNVERLASRLIEVLEPEISARQLSVNYNAERVIMRFSEDATFPSGSADLIGDTKPILDKVVEVLAQCHGSIIVSGHTDDRPIVGGRFRSNWDLSSARSVSVVHALVLNRKIEASRVVAAGRAETRPLVPNDSDENRARNRRVEIEIVNPKCTAAPP